MNNLTVQIFLDQQWHDAAEISFSAVEQGHLESTRLDYLAPYVIEQLGQAQIAGAAMSCRYPVDFTSYDEPHWPAFVLDLLPGGEGRRRWSERLNIANGLGAEFELLRHAAANPAGNLRIKDAALSHFHQNQNLPDAEGQWVSQEQHPGFSRDDIISKQEHFIEYAYNLGAAVSGATDVQGEAPKFLLVEDLASRWHAEGAIADSQVKKHWIVKFPRGKTRVDVKILQNEAKYLEVARQFGLRVGEPLQQQGNALFIPRFDRRQAKAKTERIAMESLYSIAGVARFGEVSTHETLCGALMQSIVPQERLNTALEYIKRDLLNVVMGNTDNHGRNTAVLRARDGGTSLSPLFDFAPMYLDPEGIARVTRWHKSREHAGRPNWVSVVDFFQPWLNTASLMEQVVAIEPSLRILTHVMHAEKIDEDIIARCQYVIENTLEQLRQYRHA